MSNVFLLVACFGLGIVLRRSGRLPDNASSALNGFIIHVSLPALTLLYVHDLRLEAALVYPALMPWLLFGMGFVFFSAIGRASHWPRATVGGLILTGSLANTSFLGLPMIEAFYGGGYQGIGILIDQLGTYMVLSTLGVLVAVAYSSGDVSGHAITRKILLFPPFQALLLALATSPLEYPAAVETVLGRLGATLAPLALVSVGYQLRLADLTGRLQPLAVGLAFQLLLGPALIMALFVEVLGAGGRLIQITIFEAAMAPQIGASIVAMEHKLDSQLVTLMVGLGIPLSFLSLPLWWHVLQGV